MKASKSNWIGRLPVIAICAFFALMLVDGLLLRLHHPVKVPVIGWIGVPHPPGDPGDCDPEANCGTAPLPLWLLLFWPAVIAVGLAWSLARRVWRKRKSESGSESEA